MTSSYRKVLSGLRLSSIGLWLVSISAAFFLSLVLYSHTTNTFSSSWYTLVLATQYLAYACLGLCGLGLILGFVGRCLCLPVPAAASAAPARIGLAVIFEACSLLSAVAFVGVVFLMPLPSVVSLSWCLFSWLTEYLARVKFLQFTRSLAEHLDPSLVPEAKAVQRLYLYVPGVFILAYGIAAASTLLSTGTSGDFYKSSGMFFGWLVATVATLLGVIGVWRWGGLLVGLRKAVARIKFDDAGGGANDPDRPYLERHLNPVADDTDEPNN